MPLRRYRLISVFGLLGLLFAPFASSNSAALAAPQASYVNSQAAPPAGPQAPADAPDTLVPSGVSDYTQGGVKLFWHTAPANCPPHTPTDTDPAPEAPADAFIDQISRVAVQGSLPRQIYFQQLVCDGLAGQIKSNIVADENYLYFTKADGLYMLSVEANPGDAPQLMNALVAGYAELAIDDTYVFALMSPSTSGLHPVYSVLKSNHARVFLTNSGSYAGNLQVSYAFSFFTSYTGYYLYWQEGSTVQRFNLNTAALDPILTGVKTYFAEGGVTNCSGIVCVSSDLVYYSTNTNGRELRYRSNSSGSTSAVLFDTGSDDDSIYSLASDPDHVFFLQQHFVPCSPQPCFGGDYTDYVRRRGRGTSGGTDYLFTSSTAFFNSTERFLKGQGNYLFWQSGDKVLRLPKDASALPLTNLRTTGLEITQAIQKPDNSVRLIENKRTFVRMFVQSDGSAVSGVTALLYGNGSTCGDLGSLLPVNDVGTNLTVWSSPQRGNLNDSFLFELPWSWTTCGNLSLTARLNPFHAPPQASYGNNDRAAGPFSFSVSPRLQVQFVAWQYVLFNQTHTPLFIRDILETYSWIRRAYPINSTTGSNMDSSVGFRPGLWILGDDTLGARVAGTADSCQDLYYKDKNGVQQDDRNLCASRYTNQEMVKMRAENGMPSNLFFYGMLADAKDAANNWVFPRGQACCGTAVSSGPVGADGPNGFFWFNGDGTYADWYAAHEIGHTLGRNHPVTKGPNAANRMCGQSEDDGGYPYNYTQIGVDNNTEGFDGGDSALHQPKRLYPGAQWYDVMSYCAQQWVSDYTYEAMYQYMIAHPSLPFTAQALVAAPSLSGNWVSVIGTIVTGTTSAAINQAIHLSSIDALPPLTAGGYAIRLLNGANAQLAQYAFTPEEVEGAPALLSFNQVVTLTAGTAHLQIIRLSDNAVMASTNLPAHSPLVGGVALVGAPNPVSGVVTVNWTASHPDGLPLQFDLYYDRAGSPPQPVKLNVTGTSTTVDTSMLGGGTGAIRVVASDGFYSAQASSASFTMANKPPIPLIDAPGDGLHLHYGQLVNFSGQALDYQDGSVSAANLHWTGRTGALATGAYWSKDDLPVGTNVITLTATNSVGLSASTAITIVVDDDLNLLGPTLTAGPAPLGWTFPAGATTPQTANLYVGNAGDGTVNWTATTDAAWLTLDIASGTAPSTIVVTAHPNGIPDGSGLGGHIFITAAAITQTVQIPVGLVVGDLFGKPISATVYRLYLPHLRR